MDRAFDVFRLLCECAGMLAASWLADHRTLVPRPPGRVRRKSDFHAASRAARCVGYMRTRSTLLLALVLLAGCGSSGGTWTKAGVTEQEQKRDTLDCLGQARTMLAGRDGPRPVVDQDRYRGCMANRGYTMGPGTQ